MATYTLVAISPDREDDRKSEVMVMDGFSEEDQALHYAVAHGWDVVFCIPYRINNTERMRGMLQVHAQELQQIEEGEQHLIEDCFSH